MPINHYECLLLVDVTKTQGNTDAVKGQIQAILEKHGAETLSARNWRKDELKLAYPVKGHKRGLYYLTFFKADASKIDPMQADFRLNEHILRFMTQKIPAKWIEEMKAVAMDETRQALQAMHEEAPAEGGLGGDGGPPGNGAEGGDRPPRRFGRRPADVGAEGKD